MKRLHRKDLFCWSQFNERLDIDFNSFFWQRAGGNVVIDPVPYSPHDREHMRKLGGVAWVVLTNSFHVRATAEIQRDFGAKVAGPAAEKAAFLVQCDAWLSESEPLFPEWRVFEMRGSKTPGELAMLLGDAVITGDLVRAEAPGRLALLAREKLADAGAAAASVARLAELPGVSAVLVGDGWCAFRDGGAQLRELAASLRNP